MIVCPKCQAEHSKPGTFCSRTCANARTWSDADKAKKSTAAKESELVKDANSNETRNESIRIKARKRFEESPEIFVRSQAAAAKGAESLKAYYKAQRDTLDATDRKAYRTLCKFRFALNDYPNEFNFDLIRQYGWYQATNKGNNPNGVSRDHMFSVSEGFAQGVDPYFISHPANCQLLRQLDNVHGKGRTCSITLDELYDRVAEWNKKYNTKS